MFTLPEAAVVSITVYDMLGQQVRTLLHTEFPPGTFFTQWNGDNNAGTTVATGVYLCRMKATGASGNSASVTRRMMLLK
jgi:flagellar hook assembly protein FlgD